MAKDSIQPLSSYIHVPLTIPYDQIDAFVDQSMKGVLCADTDKVEKTIIRVTKAGKFIMEGQQQQVLFKLPLKIYYAKMVGGYTFETDFDILVDLTSTIRLNADWRIITATRLLNYKITRPPVINVVGMNFDMSYVIKMVLNRYMPEVVKKTDEAFYHSDMVQKKGQMIWTEIQKPSLIDSANKYWMIVSPTHFYFSPIRFGKTEMTINGAIEAFLHVGAGPFPSLPVRPFQKVVLKDTITEGFSARINVQMPYSAILEKAKEILMDTIFMVDKKKVKIDSVNLYAEDSSMVFEAKVSGSYRFFLKLFGPIVFNDTMEKFYARDLNYSMQSNQFILKLANALFKEKIRNTFESALQYDYSEQFGQIKQTLNTFLNKYTYQNKLLVNGRLEQIKISQADYGAESVKFTVDFIGKAGVKILQMNF